MYVQETQSDAKALQEWTDSTIANSTFISACSSHKTSHLVKNNSALPSAMVNVISTLVGEEQEGGFHKYLGTVAAGNGCVYCIPCKAGRVVKFNPVDKSITHIGPDFGDGFKWSRGAINDGGVIYCVPLCTYHGILTIDTNIDTVTELDANLLTQRGDYMWTSCAAALDGCVYFMPRNARRIMKLDPNNNDAISSVGDDLGNYIGTIVDIDGCVYGIPYKSKRIVKYDPINDVTSFLGEVADQDFLCTTNGVLGRDGCIYAHAGGGRVLKFDTINNSYSFVGGNRVQWKDHFYDWGDAILVIDGCIYWPPNRSSRILRYDPHIDLISLVGDKFGYSHQGWNKWVRGAMATDSIIYCFPSKAKRILAIDPIGELLATTKASMQEYPEKFGSLFQKIEANEDSPPHASLTNYFDLAFVKFGYSKVIEIMEKCIKPVDGFCIASNLCPFMIAASCKESRVCVINHLLRCDLSWVNNCVGSLKGSESKKKKEV